MLRVTFYSYKGGVGRTLALLNVGAILAEQGREVVAIDLDLDAPGFGLSRATRTDGQALGVSDWLLDHRARGNLPITQCVYTSPRQRCGGRLRLMPVGTRGDELTHRLPRFYADMDHDSAGLFQLLLGEIEATLQPDYLLIDSRTGRADIAGVCTVELPQVVVAMCGLNEQNVSGMKEVLQELADHPGSQEQPSAALLVLSPVPREDHLGIARVDEVLRRPGAGAGSEHPVLRRIDAALAQLWQPIKARFIASRPAFSRVEESDLRHILFYDPWVPVADELTLPRDSELSWRYHLLARSISRFHPVDTPLEFANQAPRPARQSRHPARLFADVEAWSKARRAKLPLLPVAEDPGMKRAAKRLHGAARDVLNAARAAQSPRAGRIESPGRAFRSAFDEVEQLGAHGHPLSHLIQALQRVGRHARGWEIEPLPAWSSQEWTRVRTNDATGDVTRAFVLCLMIKDAWFGDEDTFLAFLETLRLDCSVEFLIALRERAASARVGIVIRLFVLGALRGERPPFGDVIQIGITLWRRAQAKLQAPEQVEFYRAVAQREIDENQDEYLEILYDTEIWPAQQALQAAVAERCRQRGVTWLHHEREPEVFEALADALDSYRDPLDLTLDQLAMVMDQCPEPILPTLYRAVAAHATGDALRALLDRLAALATDQWSAVLKAAWDERISSRRVGRNASDAESAAETETRHAAIQRWIQEQMEPREPYQRVALAWSLGHDGRGVLQPHEQALLEAMANPETPLPAHPKALPLLDHLVASDDLRVAARSLLLLSHQGEPVVARSQRIIESSDETVRRLVVQALACSDEPEARDHMSARLDDADYRVRLAALESLASDATERERERLLALSDDPSGPVRERLACLIGEHGWTDGVPHLIELLADDRDDSSQPTWLGHRPRHRVARAALDALSQFDDLPQATQALAKAARSADTQLVALTGAALDDHTE